MNFKKILPHIVALVIFAAVSALFFYPQFQGKALTQGDMIQAGGMAVDVSNHVEKYGEHPQWLGRMFGGMPSYVTSFDAQGRYIGNNAHLLNILGQPSSMLFLTMAGFYLMLLMFGVNPWLAMVGGVAYGLSTYFPIIIGAGHITKMWALQWVAPMIGSIWWAYRKNVWTGAALAGLFASLEIAAYHPQISYYFLFVVLALVLSELAFSIKDKTIGKFSKKTLILLAAGILAIGSNFSTLYYTATYTKDSIRGASELTHQTVGQDKAATQSSGLDKDYATNWSYGIGETFNLFIPNLYGGGRDFQPDGQVAQSLKKYQVPRDYYQAFPSYHGEQPFTEGPVYIGAVMVFLALFGCMVLRGRQKWWIIAPMLLAVMLAWGKNMMWLTDWFLDYFPMYNKFRTVSMILVVVQWAIPVLAIVGLQRAIGSNLELDKKDIMRKLLISGAIAAGFAIFAVMILPDSMSFIGLNDAAMGVPEDVVSAMQAERVALLQSDAFRTLILVLMSGALLWFFFQGKIKKYVLYGGLGALVLFDMWGVDRRYISPDDFKPAKEAMAVEMTGEDRQILRDTTNYRVANLKGGNPFVEANTSRFHRSVGGYHAARLRRYDELINHHLIKMHMPVYDMLNTKYFISEQGVEQNPGAMGNGWFVDTVLVVADADEEIEALNRINPRTTALVDRRFEDFAKVENTSVDSLAFVELTDYRVNQLVYKTYSDRERLAVFSEIYYDGWRVYIDGVEASPLRVDYVLRAVVVPKGDHQIVWTFAAPHFSLATWITRVSSLALILGLLVILVLSIARRNEKI